MVGDWHSFRVALQKRGRTVSRQKVLGTLLLAFGACALLRKFLQWWWARQRFRRRRFLCLTSPLEGSVVKLAVPRQRWRQWWQLGSSTVDRWRGFCPSCKRPIDAILSEPWGAPRPKPEARRKYAYVITLWGSSADYLIGAMVLGHSLRKTGSPHDLVCLHTDDVPHGFLKLLSGIWDCQLMEHVSACTDKLSFQDDQPHRFDKVFTKLRVLGLTQYEKVLMMDIDLVVLSNIDNLFQLQAPAALRRGMNDGRWQLNSGDPIDGKPFFSGRDASNAKWSWGQGTGINAGVMLLQPDEDVLANMLLEINEPNHPSHARGNGPEQDYLSRYWADSWSYIGVEYNFQLHQMFFALHPKWASNAERAEFFISPEKIKVVHFSGVPAAKPWHRVLDDKFLSYWPDRRRDDEYMRLFADEFLGHWLWVVKDPATWKGMASHHGRTEMQDLYLGEDGHIWRKAWDRNSYPTLVELPKEATDGAMTILRRSLGCWFDCFEDLQRTMGIDLKHAVLSAGAQIPINSINNHCPDTVPEAPYPTRPPPISSDLPVVSAADTGGTETSPTVENSRDSFASSLGTLQWKRDGGWWTEQEKAQKGQDQCERLVVLCSAVDGRSFVSFCEGGAETFGEHGDTSLSGMFVKVAGHHSARHFSIAPPSDNSSFSPEELSDCLAPIGFWISGVPVGAVVFLAIVGIPPEATAPLLAMLDPLGVPALEGSTSDYRAFAAVGKRPDPNSPDTSAPISGTGWFGEKRGNAKPNTVRKFTWPACHASRDVAYASISLNML